MKEYPKSRMAWLWENMEGRRILFFLGLIGAVTYSCMQIVVPYFSGRIVDEFLTDGDVAGKLSANMDRFIYLLVMMVGLTLVRVLVVYLDCMAFEHVSQEVLARIRNFLYNKVQRQDMTFFGTYRTGDLMTRMTGDLDAIRHNIAWIVRAVVESISLFSATAIFLIIMDWQLALSVLIVSPIIFFIVVLFKKHVQPMHALLREKFANMNTDAQENISGNRVVKAFAREDYEIDKFDKANIEYRETNKKTNMVWLKYFPYVETCADALPVILLLVGGLFIINGRLTMGEYVSFSGLMWAIANPMRLLGNIMNEIGRASCRERV